MQYNIYIRHFSGLLKLIICSLITNTEINLQTKVFSCFEADSLLTALLINHLLKPRPLEQRVTLLLPLKGVEPGVSLRETPGTEFPILYFSLKIAEVIPSLDLYVDLFKFVQSDYCLPSIPTTL